MSSKEYYGSKKSIAVKITSNSKGTISSVLWDSSPNLSFNPKESSGLNSSVTFDRMQNPTRIWADVSIGAEDVMDLRLSGEIGELEEYSPKGATKVSIEPQEVEVVSPEFTFNYEPSASDLKIGQPITVTIVSKPAVDDSLIDYRWVEPTDRKELANGKIEIIPKDNKPIKLHVMARVPGVGDSINDDITDTLTASEVKVTASVKGPKFDRTFKVWNKNTGMVEESKEYAIDQQILLGVEVEGVDKSDLTYKWSVDEECSIAAGVNSQELTISRHEVGTCTAKIVVSNKQGNKLGEDEVSVDITLSQEDLDMALSGQKIKQAKEKFEEAKKLYNEGKIDEAITKAEEASTLDPKNADIKTFIATAKTAKTRYMAVATEAKTLIDKDDLLSAQSILDPVPSNFKLYQPIKEIIDLLNQKKDNKKTQEELSKQKLAEAKKDYNSANIDQAKEKAEDAAGLDPKNADAKSFFNKIKTEKERYIGLANQAKGFIEQDELDNARAIFAHIPSNFQNYPPIKEIFDMIFQKEREKNELRTRLNEELSKAIDLSGQCKYPESLALLDSIIEQDPFKNTQKAFSEAKHFRQQIGQAETTLKDLMAKAREAIAKNDFKAYNQHIMTATSINKNCPELAEIKSLAEKQKKKQAADDAEKTKIDNNQEAQEYFNQSKTYMKNGNYSMVAEFAKKALALQPDNTEYLRMLGYGSMLLGDKATALQAFKKVIKLDPSLKSEMEKMINTINGPNYEDVRKESIKQLGETYNTNQNKTQTSNVVPIAPTPNNVVPIAPTPNNVVPIAPTPNNVVPLYTPPANITVNQQPQYQPPQYQQPQYQQPQYQQPQYQPPQYQPPYNQPQQNQAPKNLSNEFDSVLNQVKTNQTKFDQNRNVNIAGNPNVSQYPPGLQVTEDTNDNSMTGSTSGSTSMADRMKTLSAKTYTPPSTTSKTSGSPCSTPCNTTKTSSTPLANTSTGNNNGSYKGTCRFYDASGMCYIAFVISNNQVIGSISASINGDLITTSLSGNVSGGSSQNGQTINVTMSNGKIKDHIRNEVVTFTGSLTGIVYPALNKGNGTFKTILTGMSGGPKGEWSVVKDSSTKQTATTRQTTTVNPTTSSGNQQPKTVTVVFKNNSGMPVHYFGMGGRCGPDNKTMPGQVIRSSVRMSIPQTKYYVGRGGQVIGTVVIPLSSLTNGQAVNLIYDNSGRFYWAK